MPSYRLVFTDKAGEPPQSINFVGRDAGEALILAQRHQGPVELWTEGRRLCTLRRSGQEGRFWIISGDGPSQPAAI